MENLLGDTGLLVPVFAGIGMVGVNDDRRILEAAGLIKLTQKLQILIVIIGNGAPVLVGRAAQNGMGQGIAFAVNLPAGIDKGVGMLSGIDGVHHDRQVAAGGVLHAHGDVKTAGSEAVELVFHGTRTYGYIGEHVGQVVVVLRVEHLVGTGEAGLLHDLDVQLANGNQAL